MKKLSDTIVASIKKENIKPTPKIEFTIKNIGIFVLFVLNILSGALGVGIIIFLVTNNELLITEKTTLLERLLMSIPIAWVVMTILFIFLAYKYFINTKTGYRYSWILIGGVSIMLSLILGVIFSVFGLSEKLNTIFSTTIPYYQTTFDMRNTVWMRPDEGYLAGTIIGTSDNLIELKDLRGKIWSVDTANAAMRGYSNTVGEQIKILGNKTGENTFSATEIRPWQGGRSRRINNSRHNIS